MSSGKMGFSFSQKKQKNPFQQAKEEKAAKRRREEEAAAKVFEEFVDSFESDEGPKTFVRGEVERDNRSISGSGARKKSRLYLPDAPMTRKQPPTSASAAGGSSKKKKMSNLAMGLEIFKKQEEEREERRALRQAAHGKMPKSWEEEEDDPWARDRDRPVVPAAGSHDDGDPSTTNIYVGNINPEANETQLCELFGEYGPLASVKIMWPRDEEQRSRGRNCGFVAFMRRYDAEKALRALKGTDFMGFDMRIGWGKSVKLSENPVYVKVRSATNIEGFKSGLPFNAQPRAVRSLASIQGHHVPLPGIGGGGDAPIDQRIASAVVKVVRPPSLSSRQLIHRMVEFVIKYGAEFEARIIIQTRDDDAFKFLGDSGSRDHVYYRWKLFSLMQGDLPHRWSTAPFRMFVGGPMWDPPAIHEEDDRDKSDIPDDSAKNKTVLSSRNRDRLENMLRDLTVERDKIGEAMFFCLNNAAVSVEVVECITESLCIIKTPIAVKVARLFLISDILHNTANAPVPKASYYRTGFESTLPEIFNHLNAAYKAISGRMRAEQFKAKVLACVEAWTQWSVFPPEYTDGLVINFVANTKEASSA